MRVIAGSAKRTTLKAPEGMNTRPTTDRIKETLFNMLSEDVYDAVFLDLFAGSGAIGIEALSRGAKKAVFVEQDRRAVSVIRENLKKTHLEEKAYVYPFEMKRAFAGMSDCERYDIVFMDPPYNHTLEKTALTILSEQNLLSEDPLLIVEASLETDFSYVESLGYELLKEKCYKTNKHIFLTRRKDEDD